MTGKHFEDLAIAIACILDKNERIRTSVRIGRVCQTWPHHSQFNWRKWDKWCNVDFKGSDDLTLHELRLEADEACGPRGHLLSWIAPDFSSATCYHSGCSGHVQINTTPGPNETEIMGAMVALDCPIPKGD